MTEKQGPSKYLTVLPTLPLNLQFSVLGYHHHGNKQIGLILPLNFCQMLRVIKQLDIINNQLMKKRIILEVDKLMQRPARKEVSELPIKPLPEKKASFQQMYKQAKKHQNRNNLNTTSYYHNHHSAPTSFHSLYDSLKISRNTPKNTNRRRQENNNQKLNHSLQAKASSIEKASPIRRSTSTERQRFFDKKKQQSQIIKKKLLKQDQTKDHRQPQIIEWEGQEQFQSEWKAVIASLDHKQHEHLRQIQCFLSLNEIFHVLRSMHYIRKVEDEKYLLNLWQELEGETFGGVPSNNLREFLTFINYCPSNLCYQLDKGVTQKRIVIDGNLKIVISEAAKLQVYEEYLSLRVNRILYGSCIVVTKKSSVPKAELQKTQRGSNNIKIVEDQESSKKKIILGPGRKGSDRQNKSNLTRQKRSEQITRISQQEQKQHNQDTICYSQFSESKESGKNLTSNESQNSITNHQLIEEVVIKRPILSVDVNLGEGFCEKLTVYEGETAMEVSQRLVEKYNIDESLRAKFEAMLSGHIRNLLYRIDEVSEDMFSDREE